MPKPLHELQNKFQKIAQHRIFGEGSNRDIHITLQRLKNKIPSERTKSYAERIVAVLNGKGRSDDIQYFSLLLRRFEQESGIKAREFISFLRKTRSPIKEHEKKLEIANLDRNALQYADLLEQLNFAVENLELDSNFGIIKPQANIRTKNVELFNRFLAIKRREEIKAKEYLRIREQMQKNVLHTNIIFGCVVIIYDSSKPNQYTPNLGRERGEYSSGEQFNPGKIVIDINPEKRKDNTDIKTSLIHELRHHLQGLINELLLNDPVIPIKSARAKAIDPGERSTREVIEKDKEYYELLLDRKLNAEDFEAIKQQRRYLDELHSSVLQRKSNWFSWNEKVYSTQKEGKHFEMVGNNPKDIAAVSNLFCYLQGFYLLDRIAKESQIPGNSWNGKISKRFIENIKRHFNRAGSLLATSLTIQQAERLVAETWKQFFKLHPKIPIEHIFSATSREAKGQPSNGMPIEYFLRQ